MTSHVIFVDTVAHLVMEECKGKRLSKLLKLELICQTYSKQATVAENKEEMVVRIITKRTQDGVNLMTYFDNSSSLHCDRILYACK